MRSQLSISPAERGWRKENPRQRKLKIFVNFVAELEAVVSPPQLSGAEILAVKQIVGSPGDQDLGLSQPLSHQRLGETN